MAPVASRGRRKMASSRLTLHDCWGVGNDVGWGRTEGVVSTSVTESIAQKGAVRSWWPAEELRSSGVVVQGGRAVAEWDHARWRARISDSVTNGMSSGTKQKKSCGRDGGFGQAVVLKLKRGHCTQQRLSPFFPRLVWCQVHLLDKALESSSFGPLRWCEPQRL